MKTRFSTDIDGSLGPLHLYAKGSIPFHRMGLPVSELQQDRNYLLIELILPKKKSLISKLWLHLKRSVAKML